MKNKVKCVPINYGVYFNVLCPDSFLKILSPGIPGESLQPHPIFRGTEKYPIPKRLLQGHLGKLPHIIRGTERYSPPTCFWGTERKQFSPHSSNSFGEPKSQSVSALARGYPGSYQHSIFSVSPKDIPPPPLLTTPGNRSNQFFLVPPKKK